MDHLNIDKQIDANNYNYHNQKILTTNYIYILKWCYL